ncbi:MAG: class I SAM-dependent methyltransferase [Candidatus Omnitrophota bacterium]
MSTNWIKYWKKECLWKNSGLWKQNAKFFIAKSKALFDLDKNSSVLNIGCGSGYLEELLAPKVKKIHSVDISEQFLAICKSRCSEYDNVTASLLGNDYTDLSMVNDKFSVIICIGVIEYFKDIDEIKKLILSAQKIALPGAKMFIGDLPAKRNMPGFLWDAACSFFQSIRYMYLWSFLTTSIYFLLNKSSYRSLLKKEKLLFMTTEKLKSLISELKLNAKIIDKGLSVYANRTSILIKF